LTVDRRPDEENRQSQDIDAVAGPFAIEHTSIDSVANQRRADDWFVQVVDGLDSVIKDCVDCRFTIAFEYDAITRGMDWNCIRADLRRWILDKASSLSHGSHWIVLQTSTPVDPPIRMLVQKGQSPHIAGFARLVPSDNTLATRLKTLLDRKASKLAKYQSPDVSTILLVENDDVALMNQFVLLTAIRQAYPHGLPQGVDEVWFADTCIPEEPHFYDFTVEFASAPL